MLTKRCVFLALVLSVSLVGCKKAADLGAFQKQAMDLVAKFAPQVADLQGKITGLTGKLGNLPGGMAGVGDLMKKLTGAKASLTSMQGLLGSATATVEGAVKNKDAAALTGLLGKLKTDVGDKLGGITTTVAESTKAVAELETKAAAMKPANPCAGAGTPFMKELPGGYKLEGAATGVESMLVSMVEDAKRPVDKKSWFNFDRLVFASGSSKLDMEKSKTQLTNMSEILKAYPKIKVKIGGYTDNTGSEKANMKISGKRAEAVKAALVGMGATADRIETEGYGPAHPVCAANDTDECKAKNRRIAVRLTAK